MDLPPPLKWLESFRRSVGRALGQDIVVELKPTVNPLLHTLTLRWDEPVTGKMGMSIWNMLEKWASDNDCAFDGKVVRTPRWMRVSIVTKRRLGPDKDKTPWQS